MKDLMQGTIDREPSVFHEAMEDLAKEAIRVPIYWQRSLEQAFIDVKEKRSLHLKEFSRQGGKAKKTDELGKLIQNILERRQDISCTELLAELRNRERIPPIVEIDDEDIALSNGRQIAISGLKDRLTRAKKKLKFAKRANANF